MSLRSASDRLVHVKGMIMRFVRLGTLHTRVHFGVVDSLAVPLLVGTSFIDRCFKAIFPIERVIFPIQSRPVPTISEYTPPSDPLAALQNDSDAQTNREGRQNENNVTLLFLVVKCVTTQLNIEASVSVTTSSAERNYMTPH